MIHYLTTDLNIYKAKTLLTVGAISVATGAKTEKIPLFFTDDNHIYLQLTFINS